ncbi:hypothetical protein H9P43_006440 [Blastocladiella emersonii ATCC 22665]|nr:hypothetical protein H9P43_006440 [Blastocladiella emersonii ATCC 22665]
MSTAAHVAALVSGTAVLNDYYTATGTDPIVLQRKGTDTAPSFPVAVHVVESAAHLDALADFVSSASHVALDVEHHAAVPVVPRVFTLGALAAPTNQYTKKYVDAVARKAWLRHIKLRNAANGALLPPAPPAKSPPSIQLAAPDPQNGVTRVCYILLYDLARNAGKRRQLQAVFARRPGPYFVVHGAGSDMALLRNHVGVSVERSRVLDLQSLFRVWREVSEQVLDRDGGAIDPRLLACRGRCNGGNCACPHRPSLNVLLDACGLPRNPFKNVSTAVKRQHTLAYGAFDVDQLIPAFNFMREAIAALHAVSPGGRVIVPPRYLRPVSSCFV